MNKNPREDPVFAFTIEYFTYEKRSLTRDSRYHCVHLMEGKVFYKKQEGFVIFHSPGCILVPPFKGHQLRLHEESTGYHMSIGSQLFNEVSAKATARGLISFSGNDVDFFPVGEKEESIFTHITGDLLFEWQKQKFGFRDIIRLKLTELCINLSRITYGTGIQTNREGVQTTGLSGPGPRGIDIHSQSKKIDEICAYLEKEYHNPLSLEEIADEMGFSTSYLSRYFKTKTGMCLFEYINKLRIKRACFLLKKTDKKIIEIAYEAGYNNVSFFNRYFRKTMHMSPAEYRKK